MRLRLGRRDTVATSRYYGAVHTGSVWLTAGSYTRNAPGKFGWNPIEAEACETSKAEIMAVWAPTPARREGPLGSVPDIDAVDEGPRRYIDAPFPLSMCTVATGLDASNEAVPGSTFRGTLSALLSGPSDAFRG